MAKITNLSAHRAKKMATAALRPFEGVFYILDGRTPKRATVLGWERWFVSNPDRNQIALTEVGNITVSTVFLGIDHAFGRGPPILFETMVFGGTLDRECVRYSTYEQAEAGHHDIVTRVRAAERTQP